MKAHQRIASLRKHSRNVTPKQNLWFYKEEISNNQLPQADIKSIRNERASIFGDEFTNDSPENSGSTKIKKVNSFVVDWQM